MGKKLDRFKHHLGLEHQTKGSPPERTQRLSDSIAARLERAKPGDQVLDNHDTRGTDGVQP